jgi:mRNA-degrading endonuclease RelE of RelBE toxin-antitoxin system
MNYQVEFTPEAIVDLEALTSTIQERILRGCLESSKEYQYIEKLSGVLG